MSERAAGAELYDEGWDQWADMKVLGPGSRWLRDLALDQARRIPTAGVHDLLDVGCGEGSNTAALGALFPAAKVLGIDFSSTAIDLARRRWRGANLAFECDPTSARLVASAYDVVTCFEVLEHVDDWRELLGRITRSARSHVLLSFPTGRMRPFEKHIGHVRNFRKGEVEAELTSLGFAPVDVFYAGFPFYSPVYRDLCNLIDAGTSEATSGKFSWKQRVAASVLYTAFRRLSTRQRWGDKFVGLFRRARA